MARPIYQKHHVRTVDKINLLIRMELSRPGLNVAEVGKIIGCTPATISRLRRSAHYIIIHNQYMTGLVTSIDKNINRTYHEQASEALKFSVPLAMQTLVQQAMSAKDERVRNKAANDLLDREGSFAKVARVGMPTKEQDRAVAQDKDNQVANELIQGMKDAGVRVPLADKQPVTESIQ